MSKTKKTSEKKECCGIYAGQDCEPLTLNNNGCMYHPDNKKPKKEKALKTYVLTVSVNFPKKGKSLPKPTGFKKKILSGEKIHTVRSNYEFWKKRIDEINAGRAILSVRQWSGLPYRSKQKEITQFNKLNYQRIVIEPKASEVVFVKETDEPYLIMSKQGVEILAKNDGLEIEDFKDWFKKGLYGGIVIHFTDLVYK